MPVNTKAKTFGPSQYIKVKTVAEASKILKEQGTRARLIAGGTDLLADRDPQIEVLVDIMDLDLDFIRSDFSTILIGAATPIIAIETSPLLKHAPYNILGQAASVLGTPQIRNMATIGGNICRPSPSADSAPALLALDAVLHISGLSGERCLNIAEFFKSIKKDALCPGEILTSIRLPTFSQNTTGVFIKRGRVAVSDLALLNTAVRISLDKDNNFREVRIAIGSAAPIPLRTIKAERLLQGNGASKELIEKAAAQASEEIQPISDLRCSADYRRTLCRVLVKRALQKALADAIGTRNSIH